MCAKCLPVVNVVGFSLISGRQHMTSEYGLEDVNADY